METTRLETQEEPRKLRTNLGTSQRGLNSPLVAYCQMITSTATITDRQTKPEVNTYDATILCCYTLTHLQILTHGTKITPRAHQLPHAHTDHLNSWGEKTFFSLLKLEGIYIPKDSQYKIIDSLEIKGRSQGFFHQSRLSLRSIYPHNVRGSGYGGYTSVFQQKVRLKGSR